MMIYWVIEPFKTCDSPVMDELVDKTITMMRQENDPKFTVPAQPKYLNNLKEHIQGNPL